MPKCYVPGCNSGYESTKRKNKELGLRNPSLFSVPKDNDLLEKWTRAIPRKDRVLSNQDKVCDLHFSEECVERTYVTEIFDGTVSTFERGKPLLKTGSIPSIFPNLPAYLSSHTSKRKLPSTRHLSHKKLKADSPNHDINNSLDSEVLQEHFNYLYLTQQFQKVQLPNLWWTISVCQEYVICTKWNERFDAERKVAICQDLTARIFIKSVELCSITEKIDGMNAISSLLLKIDRLIVCQGVETRSSTCSVYFNESQETTQKWCTNCTISRKRDRDVQRLRKMKVANRKLNAAKRIKSVVKKNTRLQKKVLCLKKGIDDARLRCSQTTDIVLKQALQELPQQQKEAVTACVAASKVANIKCMRYTLSWIYECLLLRIKSKKAYDHLRRHKILILPAPNTLNKYIQSIKGAYGFQNSIFTCLAKKASVMEISDRRGAILVDEMALSEGLSFDKKDLLIKGFVDLGKYTPLHKQGKKGDHALVFMFQPFKGRSVQTLACFLSRGAASGTVLHQLLIECVILLEQSGFFVDVITSDGASRNRLMWSGFGIDEENVSCSHICDPKRKLWFVSDFPHLIKNVRNSIVTNKYMMTHLGPIKTEYWEAVLEVENIEGFNLKICPNLRRHCGIFILTIFKK